MPLPIEPPGADTPQPRRTLVLGIGNTLLGDEGIGVHVVRYLQTQSLPPDVDLVDGGTLSFTLAGAIAGAYRLIVIDAAQLEAPPGTVRELVGAEMDHFIRTHKGLSVHEVSLLDLLAVSHLTGDLPEQRAIIAVQPRSIDWSDELSPEVNQALPLICTKVMALLQAWRS